MAILMQSYLIIFLLLNSLLLLLPTLFWIISPLINQYLSFFTNSSLHLHVCDKAYMSIKVAYPFRKVKFALVSYFLVFLLFFWYLWLFFMFLLFTDVFTTFWHFPHFCNFMPLSVFFAKFLCVVRFT